jgi:hypothetical protein
MADDECLADLLLAWEDHFEHGEDIPVETLCRDRPDLAPALAARILALKKSAWMKAPVGRAEDVANSRLPSLDGRARRGEPDNFPSLLAGRYRLDRLIAEGGFGQVWQGFDLELQRPVAVKVPRGSRPPDPGRVEDFLAEARKVARLRHPGIVPVYDVARHEGVYFIVLALIDGTDLGRYVRRNPLSVREAVRIIVEAADALDYADRQGVIHRDVKPANILLDRAGKVHLTDFGIAVTRDAAPDCPEQVCGTLPYMAPERLAGAHEQGDARGDIYSLGVILHDLLQAVPPSPHRPGAEVDVSMSQWMDVAATGCLDAPLAPMPQPLTTPAAPSWLAEICRKCLSVRPDDRFGSAGELAEALRHRLAGILSEADWSACTDPARLLSHLYNLDDAPARKIRLIACACVRQAWPGLADRRSRQALDVAERYADGQATDAELWAARMAAWEATTDNATQAAASATDRGAWRAALNSARPTAAHLQCALLRDLFGPLLFRRVEVDPAWLDGNGGAVRRLAEAIYGERAFDRLPILADALEEAGYADRELLGHLRGPGPHALGCWAVDRLLGKG